MSRKWLEREAPVWIQRGIVSREQADQILALYEDKQHAIGMLPLLGGILVGLGILSFVAANWQDIPQLARLVLIILVMSGFYASGEMALRRGNGKLGVVLSGLGVVSFGGGIILIGQMFHLVAYNAGSFIIWATAGMLTALLYKSRYLYLLALLLFDIAQFYSVSNFGGFSYTAFVNMVLGLGWYGWRFRNSLIIWCFSLSVTLHALMWVTSEEIKFLWMFVPVMVLYALGDWLKERQGGYALQAAPLAAAYIFGVFMVLVGGEWTDRMLRDDLRPEALLYVGVLSVLFLVSLAGKFRSNRVSSAFEWILLVPFLYLPSGIYVMYLLSLFFFSLYVLWRGYAEEWRFKINFGTLLFLCSTLVAYGKLTWDFMDKSLFFIIGGIILIVLGWLLNRRKKQVLGEMEEAKRDA